MQTSLVAHGDAQLKAFDWSQQQSLWPIPKYKDTPLIQCTNDRWMVLKDKKQWYSQFGAMRKSKVKPQKACLAWLILYSAIWTQKKAQISTKSMVNA